MTSDPCQPGGSWAFPPASQGGDEDAEQHDQCEADTAETDGLQGPSGFGPETGTGGDDEKCADNAERSSAECPNP